MTNTTNYNLLLAEGTDLVNYLTQTNPNFSTIDSVLKTISDATVTLATEVTVGTAHALTRSLPDCPVIRFTATSNWTTNDTISVDGNNVTALKTDGTPLKTGDYIIGSEVLAVLESTRLTVFVSSAAPVNANEIVYNNITSGLSATDVQSAIDEELQIINDLDTRLSIKTKTVTGTTSSNGNLLIDLALTDGVPVAGSLSSRIITFASSSTDWYAHVSDYSNVPITNVPVSIIIYYISTI